MRKKRFLFVAMLFTALSLGFASCDNDNGLDDNKQDGKENGHPYVDLGLSVKWATCNVGASSPEDFGDYFAWGEVKPKENYGEETYRYSSTEDYENMTKYCTNSNDGIVDNKTILELKDDAAAVNMGGNWRMPTCNEWRELLLYCTWQKETRRGEYGPIRGFKITSNVKGYTESSIFLPAAGDCYGNINDIVNENVGIYWTSELRLDRSSCALIFIGHCFLSLEEEFSPYVGDSMIRGFGNSVRGVCP